MKTEQSTYSTTGGWVKKSDQQISNKAQLVFLFGDKELLKQEQPIELAKKEYPNANIVGCSSSGDVFGTEVLDGSIVGTAIWFEKTTIVVAEDEVHTMEESFEAGRDLASQLPQKGLLHVMAFAEGININGSDFVQGIKYQLNSFVQVTGGLAGDQSNFRETVVVCNKKGVSNKIVAIGFYGESLIIGHGSMGGWDSFGVDREVTRSKGNILYELDGQPALDLYKRYLGPYAANLPASALLFPLSLRLKSSGTPLVRTILAVNEENGSMVFAGDVPQGEFVRLMKANPEKLIQGATSAAVVALEKFKATGASLAILISCVGRKLVLKQRTEEEIEEIQNVVGKNCTICGFYSYGEIGSIEPSSFNCELHNQTMTVTLFNEI